MDDLEFFVTKEVAPRAKAKILGADDTAEKDEKYIYVANSMAGMRL